MMLKRLLAGLLVGVLVGAACAAAVVFEYRMPTLDGELVGFTNAKVVAYGAASLTGLLTGLIAGKPIWSSDGKVEAGLKAFFGALLGVGAMLAARHFATVELDLRAVGAGKDELCKLPFVVFPAIGMVLGAFFELDGIDRPSSEP